ECFSSQRDYCTDFWICKNARLFIAYVYSGGGDMREIFISLLVDEVRRGKHSVRTFEIVKEPEYNLSTTTEKEAG
ncbi:hypothetical protein AALC16_24560, partial [Lachnospiraceae bacterium 29-91]